MAGSMKRDPTITAAPRFNIYICIIQKHFTKI
jgi:hypothetical protein